MTESSGTPGDRDEATCTYVQPDPPFLVRMVNRLEATLGRFDSRSESLREDDLLDEARRRTRLSDFGGEEFREPLRVLLSGLQDDAELTCFGRRLAHASLVDSLSNRLRIQRELALHPEILEQPVRRPLIVVGPPRTGTTLLNHLLAQDPASRPLRTWEALWPVPLVRPRKHWPDPRVALCGIVVLFANRWIIPSWNRLHPFTREGPEECAFLLARTFVNAPMMPMRTYREWFRNLSDTTFDWCYAEYRETLQLLHWQHPAESHWVLKSPVHLWALESLMKAVPEASIIHTHRHMAQVLPSYCSLTAVFLSLYSDAVDPKRMGPAMMDIALEAIARFEKARSAIDAHHVCDMRYEEIIADPIAAVRRIYKDLDYSYTPEFEGRLHAFLARDKKNRRPTHRYTLEQFGLDEDAVAKGFSSYHERYGLA